MVNQTNSKWTKQATLEPEYTENPKENEIFNPKIDKKYQPKPIYADVDNGLLKKIYSEDNGYNAKPELTSELSNKNNMLKPLANNPFRKLEEKLYDYDTYNKLDDYTKRFYKLQYDWSAEKFYYEYNKNSKIYLIK